MSSASLSSDDAGVCRVSGALGFDTVTQLPASLPGDGDVVADLSAVERVDSAGLALLLEWVRTARARGWSVVFQGVPGQLSAIARVSGVDEILALDQNTPSDTGGRA